MLSFPVPPLVLLTVAWASLGSARIVSWGALTLAPGYLKALADITEYSAQLRLITLF